MALFTVENKEVIQNTKVHRRVQKSHIFQRDTHIYRTNPEEIQEERMRILLESTLILLEFLHLSK